MLSSGNVRLYTISGLSSLCGKTTGDHTRGVGLYIFDIEAVSIREGILTCRRCCILGLHILPNFGLMADPNAPPF